jgi:hypothetical protein
MEPGDDGRCIPALAGVTVGYFWAGSDCEQRQSVGDASMETWHRWWSSVARRS